MKKALIVFAGTLAYILGLGALLNWIFPLLHLHLSLTGDAAIFVGTLLQDGPLLLLLFLINHFVFKQKILFERYSLLKGFGILGLAWFYVIYALSGFFIQHQPVSNLLYILPTVILVGFTEEFAFRGLILGSLVTKGWSMPWAVAISSILFGMIHSVNLGHQSLYNTGLQMIYVIPVGVLLATLYLKSNNFIVPVILHAATDFSAILLTSSVNSTLQTPGTVVLLYFMMAAFVVPYLLTGQKQVARFKYRLLGRSAEEIEALEKPAVSSSKVESASTAFQNPTILENPVVKPRETAASKGLTPPRLLALIGSILSSISLIFFSWGLTNSPSTSQFSDGLKQSNSQLTAAQVKEVYFIIMAFIALIALAKCACNWIAFARFSKGWRIYYLVAGILGTFVGLISVLTALTDPTSYLTLATGVLFILAFAINPTPNKENQS